MSRVSMNRGPSSPSVVRSAAPASLLRDTQLRAAPRRPFFP